MDKQHILDEIRRTAEENGGKPLGVQAFATETGIRAHDWRGRFWARWGDAVIEAGYTPNSWGVAHSETFIIESIIQLIRKLGKYPTLSEMGLERRANNSFPSDKSVSDFCDKATLINKLLEYSQIHEGLEDVEAILKNTPAPAERK